MRIAVSGTHGTGKSTLIDEFLRAHPEFTHEPEPYTALVEDFGEEFSAEPSVEDFYRQLEFNIDRLRQHTRGERVIYERCPIDFLAYLDALDAQAADTVRDQVFAAVQHLDLIVYLPLSDDAAAVMDFAKLREPVDRRLAAIYGEDEFGIEVVEATGSTAQRLRMLEEVFSRKDAKAQR